MNLSNLSFDALPPISIPFRYFITACCFVIVAALLLLMIGEQIWVSRWHPYMIMLTHMFTLGFITMVMKGAIIQMLPVISGVGVAKVTPIGTWCHMLFSIGTLAMIGGLFSTSQFLLTVAMISLTISFSVYIVAIGAVLFKRLSEGDTITGIRCAVVALVITAILGILLLSRTLGYPLITSEKSYTNIHVVSGFSWISLLIIAVSFQVIPMFHVAPRFAKWLMKTLPLTVLLSLILLLFVKTTTLNIKTAAQWLLMLNCIYSTNLLIIIAKRKRKIPDTTINFWRVGAASIWVITGYFFIPTQYLPVILQAKSDILIGAIFIYFFATSIIIGMLIKIMPFLSYTHLQQACLVDFSAMKYLPNMHELISKQQSKTLFILHLLCGCSLLLTILLPHFANLFAMSLLIEFSWLLYLMVNTCVVYYQCQQKIHSTAS